MKWKLAILLMGTIFLAGCAEQNLMEIPEAPDIPVHDFIFNVEDTLGNPLWANYSITRGNILVQDGTIAEQDFHVANLAEGFNYLLEITSVGYDPLYVQLHGGDPSIHENRLNTYRLQQQ